MSTSTDKPAKSRTQNKTARILEAVELLVEMQESASHSHLLDQQELILRQLDTLEGKLKPARKNARQSDASNGSKWQSELKQVEKRLTEKIQNVLGV